MTDLSKSHLNIILSALEGERRNPNSKGAALKRIARHAERLGLTTDDILAAAAGLLDGRMGAEAFRATLDAADDQAAIAEGVAASAEPTPVPSDSPDDAIASDDAGAADPLSIPAHLKREPIATPAEAPARLVIPKRNGQSNPRKQREGSKQALVIEMLRRPEGATIAQIVAATGWLAHTVRGAFAGALKKKLGLIVTSEKPEGGERVYRISR
ncbi:MAG: DUF3489 domain-containing protein [Rhodospirillales bacterium]